MRTSVKLSGILTVAIFATAQAHASILAGDTFSYPNGDLPTQSGGTWANFSGATEAGDVQVVSGQAALSTVGRSGDDQILLSSGQTGTKIYAGFDVNFTSWPTGNGAYFALFKDTSTFNFQARVLVTNDSGSVRLGIANGSQTPPSALLGFDGVLTLGTTYRVVVRLDQTVGTWASSTLWINPTLETDPGVTATDQLAATNTTITAFALRQSNAQQGINTVDNLLIGTTFGDVVAVPEPSTMLLVGVGMIGLLAFRRRSS